MGNVRFLSQIAQGAMLGRSLGGISEGFKEGEGSPDDDDVQVMTMAQPMGRYAVRREPTSLTGPDRKKKSPTEVGPLIRFAEDRLP